MFFCVSGLFCLAAEDKKKEADIAIPGLLFDESLKRLIRSRLQYDTLSVTYTIEGSGDEGKSWKSGGYFSLDWDIKNQKYYFSEISDRADKDGFLESREFYGVDGKWTVILGKIPAKVGRQTAEKTIEDVIICEEETIPFVFPMHFWYAEKRPLDFFDKSLTYRRESPGIISVTTQVDSWRTTLYFQEKTGFFIKKMLRTVNKAGDAFREINEFSVPAGEYFSQNGLFFPKQIIGKEYSSTGPHLPLVRCTFKTLEINKAMPPDRFKPRLPVGTVVYDGFAKKSYVVTEKSENAQEAAIVRKLDELFEKANK
jgi:hypothetical protein